MQTINAEMFYKAANFIDTKKRYTEALSCVLVEPHENGALVIACNGSDFVCFLDREAENITEPYLIEPSKALLTACKPTKVGRKLARWDNASFSVVHSGETIFLSPKSPIKHDQYPNWRAFFNPEKLETKELFGQVVFNPSSLKAFCSLSDGNGLRFFGTGASGNPIFVKVVQMPDFIGITMPLMLSEEEESEIKSNSLFISDKPLLIAV